MKKIAGVIPARWGSTRFPGKILIPLCGKPLIQWVWERAIQAQRLELLLVATDDDRIAAAVRAFGGEVAMTRPDHPSGTDRIAEALSGRAVDAVINIQGDEPLIDPLLIDELAAFMLSDDGWDMATAATPITTLSDVQQSSVVKVVWDTDGRALYFSRSPIPHEREPEEDTREGPLYWRHIGIYAYQRAFLERMIQTPPSRLERVEKLEQLRALHIGARMKVIPVEQAGIGVDEPSDVTKAEAALRAAGLVK